MHEIITIQVGREANYLATHFWNAQDTYQTFAPEPPSAINHDIHFRQGAARDGSETYLPRALIYDLSGGFGSLAKVNALEGAVDGQDENAASIWHGPVTKLPAAPPPKLSPYTHSLLNSSTSPVPPTPETTAYFSDFAATYFHPRSLLPLSPPHPTLSSQDPSSSAPQFTSFAHGSSLFSARNAADDVLDTDFRPWLEECDSPQGVQLMAPLSGAWSGFAARYLEALRDELPKLSLWAWAVDSSLGASLPLSRRREEAASRALGAAGMAASASMLVPLAAPAAAKGVQMQRGTLWHASALLDAAVESMTLPTRMQRGAVARAPVLADWEDVLADGGRRPVARLRFGAGEVENEDGAEGDVRLGGGDGADAEDADPEQAQARLNAGLHMDLFPSASAAAGAGRVLGKRETTFARIETFRSENAHPDTLTALSRRGPGRGPVVECFAAHPPLPQPVTFPRIFVDYKTPAGAQVPVRASLSTGSGIAAWLRGLATPLGPASSAVGLPGDLPGEDREALRSALLEAADAYVEDWESGSESEAEDD